MKLLIVVEQTAAGFSAYAPDVPGCVATGSTRDAVERILRAPGPMRLLPMEPLVPFLNQFLSTQNRMRRL